MNKRKSIKALSHFSIVELNRFDKFIESPYHNVNKKLTLFGKIIIESIKNNVEIPNETSIWDQLFINIPFNDLKFRKLNSDLLKLIQDFLGLEMLNTKNNLKLRLSFEGIMKLKIESLYNSIRGQIERDNHYRIDRSSQFYFDKFKNEKLLFDVKTEFEKKNRKSDIKRELNIVNINENLDRFYFIEKLKLYATLQSWKKIANLDIEISNFNDILNLIPETEKENIPVLDIYNNITEILLHPNNYGAFEKLRRLTKENINILPLEEIRYVYDASITYAVDRVNKGERNFQQDLFNLYQEAINTEGFLLNDKLSPTSFRNISFLALRLGHFDWAEDFIYKFSEKLEEKYRENAIRFSLARLYFYRKEFNKVIDELQKVNYEDIWYNLNSKLMLIAAYFELQEFDAFEYSCNSFKVFVSREKTLSKVRKSIYLNYIKYISKIAQSNPNNQENIVKIIDEIESIGGIASKDWLLEKANELLKQKSART